MVSLIMQSYPIRIVATPSNSVKIITLFPCVQIHSSCLTRIHMESRPSRMCLMTSFTVFTQCFSYFITECWPALPCGKWNCVVSLWKHQKFCIDFVCVQRATIIIYVLKHYYYYRVRKKHCRFSVRLHFVRPTQSH